MSNYYFDASTIVKRYAIEPGTAWVRLVLMTSELIRSAAVLAQQHALRAYDAVQLAAALRTSSLLRTHDLALIFVSGDANLPQAARAEGMATENPFDHRELE